MVEIDITHYNLFTLGCAFGVLFFSPWRCIKKYAFLKFNNQLYVMMYVIFMMKETMTIYL